jgi:hypothetical protein
MNLWYSVGDREKGRQGEGETGRWGDGEMGGKSEPQTANREPQTANREPPSVPPPCKDFFHHGLHREHGLSTEEQSPRANIKSKNKYNNLQRLTMTYSILLFFTTDYTENTD